jgi:hypothetical protein
MSKDQIKYEINQVLDQFSDSALEELLVFLKELENKRAKGINQQHLNQVFTEDQELLTRLAQ